jgi:hypothetical protein
MFKRYLLLLALPLIVLSGCIRSLQPLYTEADVEFDAALVGTWADNGSNEVWQFARGDGQVYDLTYTNSDGESGLFTIHLLEISGERFLDFYPVEMETSGNSFYLFHIMGLHTIMHLRQIEPTLQMGSPDVDWLKKQLENDPTLIRHEVVDDEIILSASTAELQAFWLEHLESEELFQEYSDMSRKE